MFKFIKSKIIKKELSSTISQSRGEYREKGILKKTTHYVKVNKEEFGIILKKYYGDDIKIFYE